MTVWHCHIAVSLDGMIARPDGDYGWLAPFPAEAFGFEAFQAEVDAVLMGRATFEAVRHGPDGLLPGRPTTVLTRRPLAAPPPGVRSRGDAAAAVAELEAEGRRRVWVEGGGQAIRAMLALGRLDVLEMALVPVVLGAGIPLFPPGTVEAHFALRHAAPKPGGALHLIYDRRSA